VTEITLSEEKYHGNVLSGYAAVIDFGDGVGTQKAHAVLDSKAFPAQTLLNKQLLTVINLDNGVDAVTASILSVGGQAVLQPAKQVANGYVLA